jgi:hypothetical protein
MRRLTTLLLLAAIVFSLAAAAPVYCQAPQAVEMKALISGDMFPLTVQLKDLTAEWRRVAIGAQAEASNPLAIYAAMFSPGGGAYYTKGQTVSVMSETFVVTYRVQSKVNLQAMMQRPTPPAPAKLTPETTLGLSLLNLRTVSSIDDIRPFDLKQEIAESEKAATEAEEAGAEVESGAGGEAGSLSNLKQMALAVVMYAQDSDEVLPPLKTIDAAKEALSPYVRDESIFTQPDTDQPYKTNPVLSGKKLAHITDRADMILFYEAKPAEDGTRGASFLDGHAKRLSADEWERYKKISKIP